MVRRERMRKFNEWRDRTADLREQQTTRDGLVKVCLNYFGATLRGEMTTVQQFRDRQFTESVESSRYSVEVNYRTTGKEAMEGFAKIALGYVSAALKNHGYHTKHVFTEKPLRLLVSSRNWDDGEWSGVVTWNPDHNCFVVSKGFYNKERRTVSLQHNKKCEGDSAAEVARELHNMMHSLKNEPDRHLEKLKPVPLKRGPKR